MSDLSPVAVPFDADGQPLATAPGTPADSAITIQGDPAGTPVPVTGSVTATVDTSLLATQATLAQVKTALDTLVAALPFQVGVTGSVDVTDAFGLETTQQSVKTAVEAIQTALNVNLSTRASEVTLDAVKTAVESLVTQLTNPLPVSGNVTANVSNAFNLEATQLLIKTAIDAIKAAVEGTLDVAFAAPQHVIIDSGTLTADVDVDVSTLATHALQTTGNASLASIDGKTPALVTGRVPVDGSGVTQPVSGSVTATISGTPNVAVTSSVLPTGAATEATLSTRVADSTITARLNTLGAKTSANSAPVVLASDQAAIPITDNGSTLSVDDNGGSLTVDGSVAVSNFPATYPVTDSGGSLTVDDGGTSISIDDGGNTITVDGTVSVTGVSTSSNQTTLGSQTTKINDGTNTAGVKAASTAVTGSEPALVVVQSPNTDQTSSLSISSVTSNTVLCNGMQSVAIQITGTWLGTFVFEGSRDGGTTYASLAMDVQGSPTTATGTLGGANGTWTANCAGYSHVRLRSSAWGTGTAVTYIRTSTKAYVPLQGVTLRNTSGDTGTFANPIRVDPTGTSVQPVVGTSLIAGNTLMKVGLYDASGNHISTFGGGTQFADGDARGTATGTLMMVDDGVLIQAASGDSSGRLNVNVNGTVPVSIAATVPTSQTVVTGSGSLTAVNDEVKLTLTNQNAATFQFLNSNNRQLQVAFELSNNNTDWLQASCKQVLATYSDLEPSPVNLTVGTSIPTVYEVSTHGMAYVRARVSTAYGGTGSLTCTARAVLGSEIPTSLPSGVSSGLIGDVRLADVSGNTPKIILASASPGIGDYALAVSISPNSYVLPVDGSAVTQPVSGTVGSQMQVWDGVSSWNSAYGDTSGRLNVNVIGDVGGGFKAQLQVDSSGKVITRLSDGTNQATIKAASTPATGSEAALVVAISPNNTVGVTIDSSQWISDGTTTPTPEGISVFGWDGSAVRSLLTDSAGRQYVNINGAVTISDGGSSITVDGTVTANIGTTGGLALDATLTGGSQLSRITDGTNTAVVAAASTAALSTNAALVVEPRNPSTAAVTSVSGSASSVTLLSANTLRKSAKFFNDSTAVAYLKFGTTASSSDFTVKLAPDSYYEIPPLDYTGRVDCIWVSATGAMKCTEVTV